jgi:hypothetical protein
MLPNLAADGTVLFRKKLSRPQFQRFMAEHPRCLAAMEARDGAHHWARSAHHDLGQRHLTGRTNRPDKSPHSITTPKAQKFPANEGGIHKRRLDPRSF